MTAPFVHLHLHTEFSLVDGLIRVKPLVKAVAEAGMPAVAVTDQGNLFSLVKFYREALGLGVKPIVGADVWVRDPADPARPSRLVVLCRDATGYANLKRLLSDSYVQGAERGFPTLAKEWLVGRTGGLTALSGAREGDVGRALLGHDEARAETLARAWSDLFAGDYFLELQRTGRAQEEELLHASVELALRLGIGVVATNDVRFLRAEDFDAHEVKVCIQEGRVLGDPRRPRPYSEQQYLRTPQEMAELFADIPEALENTVEIARRCNLVLELGKNHLPDFPIPSGLTMEAFFVAQAQQGLEARLTRLLPAEAPDLAERRRSYDERLQRELDVIIQMGFPGYFLIVADFIRWAKDNGIPVGPGRGSGAGSLVAYALQITDLDPLAYDLLFERFLNPERVSMPDFDVDFCMENRDRVIDYVAEKYGREKVAQIATHGSMAAKAVVRDVGRVLGQPYGFVDRIAKLIPFEIGMTLEKALEQEEDLKKLYDEDEEVRAIIDMARKPEGLARNVGRHAGGVVIAPTALTDFSPLYKEPGGDGGVVTQFDKDDVEAVGLVKFDFLGLRTLTIIDWAVQTINAARAAEGQPPLDITAIPTDDAASYDLLKRHQTTAVFQLESRGMKEIIKRLQPDCFEDIVALVALYRPGPLQSGMVDDFIARKHGKAKVEYPHPKLAPILKPTYGIILYQEQVMQIAQVLAGYTLGGADLLRRAMGKKKKEEMAKQREVFIAGATERGVDEAVAQYIFDLMEKFAGYGFNKSHSAAYALVAYQTAWLKAHYPAAFMAAVLSSDMDNTDKVVVFLEEARTLGLRVIPPSINRSEYRFTADGQNTVIYGLGAIKGVGEAAIDGILAERRRGGVFADLFDFCARIDLRKANKRVMEALNRSGALDGLGPNRRTLTDWLPAALQSAEQRARSADMGMTDLFGVPASPQAAHRPECLVAGEEWDEDTRLAFEKETLGLYLTGHPVERYLAELGQFTSGRLAELATGGGSDAAATGYNGRREKPIVAAGLVVSLRIRRQRNGRIAFVTLDDRSGRIDVKVFERTFERDRSVIVKDRLVVVEGKLGYDEYSDAWQVTADKLVDMDQAREQFARRLVIAMRSDGSANGTVSELAGCLEPYRSGSCRVWVDYRRPGAIARMRLGDEWSVHPRDELLRRLRDLPWADGVEIVYGRGGGEAPERMS